MRTVLLALGLLAGCDEFTDKVDDVSDDIEGYTETRVIEALYLGVAEPDSEEIDLSDTDFAKGAALTVFVADASDPTNLENSLVSGATVRITSDSSGSIDLTENSAGTYTATAEGGLAYTEGEGFTVAVEYDSATSKVMGMSAPQPVDLGLETTHSPQTNLVVDLTDYSYDAVLVAVLDTLSGEITYSNEPQDVKEIYDFTHSDESVKRHEIPASAFDDPDGSVYAVGVAGMEVAGEENLEDFNTALSSLMVGKMRFYAVSTFAGADTGQ